MKIANNIPCPKCKNEKCFIFEKAKFIKIICETCKLEEDYLKNN